MQSHSNSINISHRPDNNSAEFRLRLRTLSRRNRTGVSSVILCFAEAWNFTAFLWLFVGCLLPKLFWRLLKTFS